MNQDALVEFFKLLGRFEPFWVAVIIATAILAYKAPQLIKELFAGIRGLFLVRRDKNSSPKRKPISEPAE